MNITIRKAAIEDKDFVIEAITEAEKSGSKIVSYCALFSITENEFRNVLSNILDEEMEGQELCLSNFLIADVDGEKAAAVSTWIEKEDGVASSIIKTNLLMYFMDREVLLNAKDNLALMNEINIPRAENALQIECVYTVKKFRGSGLAAKLIDEHIARKLKAGAIFDKAQVILLKNNTSAMRSYEKAGFHLVAEKSCSNHLILNILPSDTKILMEKEVGPVVG